MTNSISELTEAPARRVIAFLGTSHIAGGGASAENATGFRTTFQRVLCEEGISFRCVGRGYGAANGTGTTWGRFPTVDDFHDAPAMPMGDWRHWGFSGRRLSMSTAVTAIDATANSFTAPGHGLSVGTPFTFDFSGTDDPPVLAVDQPVYYAATVSGDVITAAQYEGSTTPIDVTAAGSGAVRINEGLIEMLPGIAEACDETPTDVVIDGGTNDITSLIAAGYSEAEVLEILQQREREYEKKIAALWPRANKHRVLLLDVKTGATNQAACSAVALAFNAWMVRRAKSLGKSWNVIEATSRIPASAYQSDGIHLTRVGNVIWGEEIARQFVQAVGAGLESAKVPRALVRRPPQACVELRAVTDRCTFGAQAALNPGSDSFFFAVDFLPFELKTGLNAVVQQENPYANGCLLGIIGARAFLYWKSAGPCLPNTAYIECMKAYRWHRLFAFFDAKQEAALFCNGRLVQRVVTTAAAITSSTGWAVGGLGSTNSAPGLYRRFLVGHSPNLSIEDAWEMAIADHWDGEDPEGTTYKARLDEGTGTTLASSVQGTTAGALAVTTGGWVSSGKYEHPADHGYRKPELDQRIASVTAAYTATYNELVKCDPTSAGFTITLPTAVGHEGERIWISNVTASTNAIVVDGNASETIDGATTATINTAQGDLRLISDGTNWISS